MTFTADALVLRSVDVGDFDRLLTLLTPEQGKITVMAKGARGIRSTFAAISQPFVYANFEIYRKNDANWLKSGTAIEYFSMIRKSVEKMSLASYLCDLACEVTADRIPGEEVLRLTLNTLYGLNRNIMDMNVIKAVFEWRIAGMSGYMPDINGCGICRKHDGDMMYMDVMNGRFVCESCMHDMAKQPIKASVYDDTSAEASIIIPMKIGAAAATSYVLTSDLKRIFAFDLKDKNEIADFCRAAECYVLSHLERSFETLEFYKTICR